MEETYEFTLSCKVVVTAPTEADAVDLLTDVFSGEMGDFGIYVDNLAIVD